MVMVIVGSDTYGATQWVDGTPIVTKFVMISLFPVWPEQSYYFSEVGESKGMMLPVVRGITARQFSSLPLAKLSIQSVMLAYLRGIAGALIAISVIPLVLALVIGTGRMDTFARVWVGSGAIALVLGLVIGAASYLMGRHVTPRSGKIRSACAQVLGLAADPAMVTCECAETMRDEAGETLRECGLDDPESAVSSADELSNEVLALLLVRARAKLQLGRRSEKYESQTDRILARLH